MLKELYLLTNRKGYEGVMGLEDICKVSSNEILPYCRANNITYTHPGTFMLNEEEVIMLKLMIPTELTLVRVFPRGYKL